MAEADRDKAGALRDAWAERWQDALAIWSRFTRLSEPRWCFTAKQAKKEGLGDSFAMIRLTDHAVVVSFPPVIEMGLEGHSLEIMAHEVGHHVYAPADLRDNALLIAHVRAGLPSVERFAPYVANLYTDLLINDRLQRSEGLDMAGVYKKLKIETSDKLWNLYMRVYEILWSMAPGDFTWTKISDAAEGDARLGARVVRAYSRHWIDGAGRFAALCLPYLLDEKDNRNAPTVFIWADSLNAGAGDVIPDGLAALGEGELEGAIHPSEDRNLTGLGVGDEPARRGWDDGPGQGGRGIVGGRKNKYRTPEQYRELMESVGVKISPEDMVIKYYRERAVPHLVKFPTREVREATDPLPEGLEEWDVASPISNIDWLQSVIRSPLVVPGVTTVERTYGATEGSTPEKMPVDLYLGIDCSGSMANPARNISYPVLAGAVILLSALRVGARAKVCLSGEPGRYSETDDFIRDEKKLMSTLTGYLGTGYAFGIKRLEDTFLKGDFGKKGRKKPRKRPVHILVVTDSDIFHMLGEVKNGWDIAELALGEAGGGGTYVLNMSADWGYGEQVQRMREQGWNVHFVNDWEELVAFARAFARAKYGHGRGGS